MDDVKTIKGISDKRAEDLKLMGVESVSDLLRHYPRDYIDLEENVGISEAFEGQRVLVIAELILAPKISVTRNKLKFVKAQFYVGATPLSCIWFNQVYVAKKLIAGQKYVLFGMMRCGFGSLSLVNPLFEELDSNKRLKGILPVYRLKGGITQNVFRDAAKSALSSVVFNSAIPDKISYKYDITPLGGAYKKVHCPENKADIMLGSNRIALEEYFILISAFSIIKGSKSQVRLNRYDISGDMISKFAKSFPFELTGGQKSAVNEIFSDMRSERVMNRLLEGDVGSGKTVVAIIAMYMALMSGFQAVMLAPTEVLARQNYEVAQKYLKDFEIGYLAGSVPQKEKTLIKQKTKTGEIKLLVGTHAILCDNVEFNNLSICVCDEQHRFGVAQRSALLAKGVTPDVLVMSATPIPRTLSLIIYGDLDVTTITEKPNYGTVVKTSIVPSHKYDDMLSFIKGEVKKGRQAYFVCPKIEDEDEGELTNNVKTLFSDLSSRLPSVRFAMLHGKMKDKEKLDIMRRFKDCEFDALVSTTVIEVGIDVKNASIMVIYSADRFGLSQLHQLRGRIGRSNIDSYCFLLADSTSEKALERLKTLKDNSDGFKIAEYDFKSRGSGDFLGTRQSGKIIRDIGDLRYDNETIYLAKRLSDEALSDAANYQSIKGLAISKYESLKDVTLN